MPLRALREFLDSRDVRYTCYNHPPTYTAQETAEVLRTTGHELAKTVLLKLDDRLVMAVLPACEQVDFDLLKAKTGAGQLGLAGEEDMTRVAPLCDTGSIPPIGNLFGLEVIVAKSLSEDEIISFNAGYHTEDVRMSYADFEYLTQPRVMSFTRISH